MSDLIDEIKEDLAREKYALLWQKYGNYVIGAAIAVLIVTGAGVTGRNYLNSIYASYSDELYDANSAPEAEALVKYDHLIANANGTYKAIAGLRKASIVLQSSKIKEALAIYKNIIDNSASPQELRDVAKLLYIAVSSNQAVDNKENINEDAKKYLQENISGTGIFKYSAMEITAFQEVNDHNYTKAKDIFNSLIESRDAPQNIKSRAREMIEAIANMGDTENHDTTGKTNG